MASITKRETKSGSCYRIQVKIKDRGSGVVEVKTTTYKPPQGLTAKQTERDVASYAERYENKLKEMHAYGNKTGASGKTTFKEFAEKWLEKTKIENSLNHYANSKDAIERANAYIGGYPLQELTPSVIQNFYNKLDMLKKTIVKVTAKVDEVRKAMSDLGIGYNQLIAKYSLNSCTLSKMLRGETLSKTYAERVAKALKRELNDLFNVTQTKEKYAYESIHKVKRTVRSILAVAKKQRIIDENFAKADFIDFPKRPPHEIEFLSDVQAKIFYKTLMQEKNITYKPAMMIALLTGVRRGELCGLEWDDIDFVEESIEIKRSITTVKSYGVIEKEPKTESSKRTISISSELVEQLKSYKEWWEYQRAILGDRLTPSKRLFTKENGERINPGIMRNWLDKICSDAGLAHVSMHSLRHTNITLQIMAGVPLVTVAGRAGHARTSTTTDIYSHFLKSNDKHAAQMLSKVFE